MRRVRVPRLVGIRISRIRRPSSMRAIHRSTSSHFVPASRRSMSASRHSIVQRHPPDKSERFARVVIEPWSIFASHGDGMADSRRERRRRLSISRHRTSTISPPPALMPLDIALSVIIPRHAIHLASSSLLPPPKTTAAIANPTTTRSLPSLLQNHPHPIQKRWTCPAEYPRHAFLDGYSRGRGRCEEMPRDVQRRSIGD